MLVLDNNLLSTLSISAMDGLGNLQVTVLWFHFHRVYALADQITISALLEKLMCSQTHLIVFMLLLRKITLLDC